MVYFYQPFLNIDDVILKLYTSLCQKAKCTLFGALYVCGECLKKACDSSANTAYEACEGRLAAL